MPDTRPDSANGSLPAKGCACQGGGGCGGKGGCHADGKEGHAHAEFPPIDGARLLHGLMDHAGLLAMGLDPAGRIQWLSRGLEDLSGWPAEQLYGRDWTQALLQPQDRLAATFLCSGGVDKKRGNGHVKTLLRRDGSRCQIEWQHTDLRDEHDHVTGILCIGANVSALQAATEALVTTQKCSNAVLETAVNAIVTMDEKGRIESVNSAAERIFGYARAEMIGQNIVMLMPQPYRGHHDKYVQSYLETGQKKIIGVGREVMAQRKDGTIFPIDLSVGEAILNDGRRIFTGILRDLSDRKQLEEKILHISEEEQHRIGQDIHDDLCQQLAAIGCLAKVALQRVQKGGQAEADSLQEILRLVTQANVRAREMSRGLMPVVLDSAGLMAALADLAQGTERIFRVSCPFRCDKPVQVPDNKMATQLFRIAQEAVANAIKHSSAERIEISLSEEDEHLLLGIRDNGVGMPNAVAGKNTGMGLLTMSHRARMMGGMLTVDPEGSGGTLVRCRVPIPATPKSPLRRPL